MKLMDREKVKQCYAETLIRVQRDPFNPRNHYLPSCYGRAFANNFIPVLCRSKSNTITVAAGSSLVMYFGSYINNGTSHKAAIYRVAAAGTNNYNSTGDSFLDFENEPYSLIGTTTNVAMACLHIAVKAHITPNNGTTGTTFTRAVSLADSYGGFNVNFANMTNGAVVGDQIEPLFNYSNGYEYAPNTHFGEGHAKHAMVNDSSHVQLRFFPPTSGPYNNPFEYESPLSGDTQTGYSVPFTTENALRRGLPFIELGARGSDATVSVSVVIRYALAPATRAQIENLCRREVDTECQWSKFFGSLANTATGIGNSHMEAHVEALTQLDQTMPTVLVDHEHESGQNDTPPVSQPMEKTAADLSHQFQNLLGNRGVGQAQTARSVQAAKNTIPARRAALNHAVSMTRSQNRTPSTPAPRVRRIGRGGIVRG